MISVALKGLAGRKLRTLLTGFAGGFLSLLLLRIQGDLNQLALAMRDMLDPDDRKLYRQLISAANTPLWIIPKTGNR